MYAALSMNKATQFLRWMLLMVFKRSSAQVCIVQFYDAVLHCSLYSKNITPKNLYVSLTWRVKFDCCLRMRVQELVANLVVLVSPSRCRIFIKQLQAISRMQKMDPVSK